MAAGTAELNRPRLSAASVDALAPEVARPCYDRSSAACGIVHLGVGAFMRAHVATYCDAILGIDGGDWAIAGVSLRHPDVSLKLGPQDCLYLVASRGAGACDYRLIAALRSMAVATENTAAVARRLASPGTRIVSMTVTEKGYCVDTHEGGLDADHPDIRHDLAQPATPWSLVGFLYAACRQRKAAGAGPVSFLSCDNLPGNGCLLRQALLDFANLAGEGLQDWIAANVAFPSTMVDRIVPATTDADVAEAAQATGVIDRGLVCTEPFTQWVIEDRFANGRPAWEKAGALLVADVEPYETAKLRLLNGAHSTIAYLGYLAGHEFVHEVMADDELARFVAYMMREEISPVTPAPAGMEHERYIDELLERFRNPSLRHRTWQIAMDGSQKLPQRLLATIRLQRAAGGRYAGLSLAVAAWMRYALGSDELGRRIDVSDPLAERFAAIAKECGLAPGAAAPIVGRFISLTTVFGAQLPTDDAFRARLVDALEGLLAQGVAKTVREFLVREAGQR